VRDRQKTFDTAEWYDYALGFIVAAFLSGIGAGLVTLVGSIGFFGLLIISAGASTAGVIIAEGVRAVTRKRRSRPLFITIAAGVVAGALPVVLIQLIAGNIFGIVFQVIYLVIVTPIVYTRLSGIQLFR
jgi:hypothetical protein